MADSAASTTTAPAASGPVQTRPIREILGLHDLLASLDAHVEVTTGADGKPQRGKTTAYTFGAKARYAIITNLGLTERVRKKFEKARDAAIMEVSGGVGKIEPKDPENPTADADYVAKLAKVNEELKPLLESDETLPFRQIPIDDLRLEQNPLLPNTTLVALGDLVSAPKE